MKRLGPDQLGSLPSGFAGPAERPKDGSLSGGNPGETLRIVHLGLGAFARAHLAAYTQDANELSGEDWQITGVSLQRPDMRDSLAPQQGLYTLVTQAPEGPQHRIVNVVCDVLVAPENPGAVIAQMADPSTHIVSLTVTEKGYCHDPSTALLRLDHHDIMHDRANPDRPRSAIGFIIAGLEARRARGLKPFTVLCCDNLPANGVVVRGLVLQLAQLRDQSLAAWIEKEGAFPSTMVDRIVPATTHADIAKAEAALGLHDAAPVMAEPFRQWVIENHFVSARPHWERVGAQLVEDVAPFELMKLRLLNGAHSTLAYLGYLAGHETVAEASADMDFVQMLHRLWAEIIPTVPVPAGVDLSVYAQSLLSRFQNPAIRHRTWQIAMDGSQKLPQRLLATIQDRLAAGGSVDALCLGVAGWMRYVMAVDEKGAAIDVKDPLSVDFAAVTARAAGKSQSVSNIDAIVDGLLCLKPIFGDELPHDQHLREILNAQLESLVRKGALETLRFESLKAQT